MLSASFLEPLAGSHELVNSLLRASLLTTHFHQGTLKSKVNVFGCWTVVPNVLQAARIHHCPSDALQSGSCQIIGRGELGRPIFVEQRKA